MLRSNKHQKHQYTMFLPKKKQQKYQYQMSLSRDDSVDDSVDDGSSVSDSNPDGSSVKLIKPQIGALGIQINPKKKKKIIAIIFTILSFILLGFVIAAIIKIFKPNELENLAKDDTTTLTTPTDLNLTEITASNTEQYQSSSTAVNGINANPISSQTNYNTMSEIQQLDPKDNTTSLGFYDPASKESIEQFNNFLKENQMRQTTISTLQTNVLTKYKTKTLADANTALGTSLTAEEFTTLTTKDVTSTEFQAVWAKVTAAQTKITTTDFLTKYKTKTLADANTALGTSLTAEEFTTLTTKDVTSTEFQAVWAKIETSLKTRTAANIKTLLPNTTLTTEQLNSVISPTKIYYNGKYYTSEDISTLTANDPAYKLKQMQDHLINTKGTFSITNTPQGLTTLQETYSDFSDTNTAGNKIYITVGDNKIQLTEDYIKNITDTTELAAIKTAIEDGEISFENSRGDSLSMDELKGKKFNKTLLDSITTQDNYLQNKDIIDQKNTEIAQQMTALFDQIFSIDKTKTLADANTALGTSLTAEEFTTLTTKDVTSTEFQAVWAKVTAAQTKITTTDFLNQYSPTTIYENNIQSVYESIFNKSYDANNPDAVTQYTTISNIINGQYTQEDLNNFGSYLNNNKDNMKNLMNYKEGNFLKEFWISFKKLFGATDLRQQKASEYNNSIKAINNAYNTALGTSTQSTSLDSTNLASTSSTSTSSTSIPNNLYNAQPQATTQNTSLDLNTATVNTKTAI